MRKYKTKNYNALADTEACPIFTEFKSTLLLLLAAGTLVSGAWAQTFPDNQGWKSEQYGSTMMTGDLNNDQHADVCGRGAAGIYCALSNGTSFGAVIWATKDFSDAEGWNDPKYYGSLRLGDVNADHFADVCGRAADGIYCALGKGDGTFYPATRWTPYYNDTAILGGELWYSNTMMLGDINNDQHADVCMRTILGVLCSLSTGNGFGPPMISTTDYKDSDGWGNPIYYSTLRLADVNGDKNLDLCARGLAGILCSLGDGTGKFALAQLWTPAFSNANGWSNIQYASTITFGDINGDGKDDVCGSNISGIYCSFSNGTSFPSPNYIGVGFVQPVSLSVSYYGTYRLADVDGDKRADMCARTAAGFQCQTASVAFPLELQSSGQPVVWGKDFSDNEGWNALQYGTTFMYGDLLHDGRQSVCARGAAGIYCALSDGTKFDPLYLATTAFSDTRGYDEELRYSTLRMGDVNGDHLPDICSREPDGVWCALGTADGHFNQPTRWTSDYSNAQGFGFLQYASTIMLADVNHDGAADVCMRGGDGIFCSLSTRSGFAPFRLAVSEFSDNGGWFNQIYYSSLRLADINGDHNPDVCGRGFAGIICTLGNGDGTFGTSQLWTSEFSNNVGWGNMEYASTIMLGDVDGDGKADVCGRGKLGVFCAISTGHSFGGLTPFSLFSNNDSQFGSDFTLPNYYGSIRLADVTGDHMADLCGRGPQGVYCGIAFLYFQNSNLVH